MNERPIGIKSRYTYCRNIENTARGDQTKLVAENGKYNVGIFYREFWQSGRRQPYDFYRASAVAASPVLATIGMSVCLSVCPSVRHTLTLCENYAS